MTTAYLHPILAACLIKAEQKIDADSLGDSLEWTPQTEAQAEFVRALPGLRNFVTKMPADMLDSIGSTSADIINKFLERHGLGIRLPPLGPDEFGTAAVLDILTKWKTAGTKTTVHTKERRSFPAVEMPSGFTVYKSRMTDEVVQIDTDGDVQVLLTMSASLDQGMAILQAPRERSGDTFIGLHFPMVDLDQQQDVDWMVGLARGDTRVTKALAQVKLRLNELGAHAKAGAAIRFTRSMGPRLFIIDQPFTIAFIVADQIAVAFHVTKDDWKAPPNLAEAKDKARGDVW